MKPFRFTLETVLTLRAREEETAKETYAMALQERTRAAAALNEARTELEAYHQALADTRQGTSYRHEQMLFLNALRSQQVACQRLSGKVLEADHALEGCRKALLAAHQRHESLVRLKDSQLSAYRAACQREEETTVADMITARYAMNLSEIGA
jgi:flagellar export protein FliJ